MFKYNILVAIALFVGLVSGILIGANQEKKINLMEKRSDHFKMLVAVIECVKVNEPIKREFRPKAVASCVDVYVRDVKLDIKKDKNDGK